MRLGLTSFGGPIAHLGYFREEFVQRRKWITEHDYADLVALCQFLPGPASSQVGMALGQSSCGSAGALAAWAGFTLPSALILIACALGISHLGSTLDSGALQGLKIVAVAVVAHAVWGMARTFCRDLPRIGIMLLTAAVSLIFPSVWTQLGTLGIAAIAGRSLLDGHSLSAVHAPAHAQEHIPSPIHSSVLSRRSGSAWLFLYFGFLAIFPLLRATLQSHSIAMADAFYRAGALVFGGGHVVLPLLQAEVVPSGWVTHDGFVAGYGLAQAVPGPLFTFAAYLGASMNTPPTGWGGGGLALVSIFAPSLFWFSACGPFGSDCGPTTE